MHPSSLNLTDISPELILVDPELRAAVLRLPPAPFPIARAETSTPASVRLADLDDSRVGESVPVRHGRRIVKATMRLVFAASLLVNALFFASLHDGQGDSFSRTVASTEQPVRQHPRSDTVDADVASARAPSSTVADEPTGSAEPGSRDPLVPPSTYAAPGKTSTETTALDRPILRWKAVSGADYYDVVLWRDHRRLLDLWPTSTEIFLPHAWSREGVRGSLVPGRYLWFVYAGFRTRGAANYAPQVQNGVLVVRG